MPEPDLAHHGDREVAPGLVDLAVNVAVPGPPAWLAKALAATLDDLAAYPDSAPATAAVAGSHAIARDRVLLTNGAAEAFTLIARMRPWRRPVVVHPQFTEPEAALRGAGCAVDRLMLRAEDDFGLGVDAPGRIPAGADLVVIGNPTNPTSRLHPREEVVSWVRPGRVVVVDEAFMDAVPGQAESVLRQAARPGSGLLVTRSLTKTFGVAGLRCGYLVGAPEVVSQCAAVQPPWSVNSLALEATRLCASEAATLHIDDLAQVLRSRVRYLATALAGVGIQTVSEPQAPFVLARHPQAWELRAALRERGFAVRRGDTFPGLGRDWLRIAARDETITDTLVATIAEELS